VRRLALSLSIALLAALGVPAAASAASAAPAPATAPFNKAVAAPTGGIEAMSCLSAKSCIGIGDYASPVKGVSAFLRTWNGADWGPIYGAVPASSADTLSSISCTSAKFCVAVGDRATGVNIETGNEVYAPAVAMWNGSAWTKIAPPAPASSAHFSELLAVSCANARSCVAVGQYNVQATDPEVLGGVLPEGFIDVWNGAKWAASYKTTAGKKGFQATELGGVSCRSATNCVAVGSTYEPIFTTDELMDTTDRPVALTWNGKKWAASAVPTPSSQPGVLDGVSCWSVSRCVAVGNYFEHPKGSPVVGKITLMAERWNGAKWSVTNLPTSGFGIWLSDVSCVSASNCLAIGVNGANGDHYRSLADAWNGKTWRAIAVATPNGGAGSTEGYPNSFELASLTCATTKDCVAFGFAGPLGGGIGQKPFAELYAGSRLSNIADA
jgi:hypothetical protein